jgi:hypothetical protein
MSPAAVSRVESLGVVAVQDLHAVGKVLAGGVDDQVVVVRHQAKGVTRPLVPADDESQQAEKIAPVVRVVVDGHLRHAARGDVKEPVREGGARNPRHPGS